MPDQSGTDGVFKNIAGDHDECITLPLGTSENMIIRLRLPGSRKQGRPGLLPEEFDGPQLIGVTLNSEPYEMHMIGHQDEDWTYNAKSRTRVEQTDLPPVVE